MCSPFPSPLTWDDARERQLSERDIVRHLRSGEWQRAHRGVLVPHGGAVERLEALGAAVLTQPIDAAVIGLRTAGELWNLILPETQDPTVHLVVPRSSQGHHRPGIRLHRAHLDECEKAVHLGIPVTSSARTVLDLARELPRVEAVIAIDSALRQKLCAKEELEAGLDRLTTLRGVRAAREAVAQSDAGSESPPETVFRLILVDGGLPRPIANFVPADDWGYVIARGDLVYPHLLLWLEYDGFLVHTTRQAFRQDRSRRRMLERRGWQVKQFSDVDLRDPAALVAEARQMIEAAPARIAALPPGLSPEVDHARRLLDLRSASRP